MSKVIMITSFKGGVGKTTVSANLSMALARKGAKVVVIDCDLESRCLDIVLSMENASLFNICDVLCGVCSVEDAICTDKRCENLSFIEAPLNYEVFDDGSKSITDIFSREAVKKLINKLSESFDYIILDLPARPDRFFINLVAFSDYAFVVSMHTAASIRAAEKTGAALSELYEKEKRKYSEENNDDEKPGELEIRLLVNCFFAKDAKNKSRPGIYEIIGSAMIKLLGVIPYDKKMADLQEKGLLCEKTKKSYPFYAAMDNISERILGTKVPLLKGVKTGVFRRKIT